MVRKRIDKWKVVDKLKKVIAMDRMTQLHVDTEEFEFAVQKGKRAVGVLKTKEPEPAPAILTDLSEHFAFIGQVGDRKVVVVPVGENHFNAIGLHEKTKKSPTSVTLKYKPFKKGKIKLKRNEVKILPF